MKILLLMVLFLISWSAFANGGPVSTGTSHIDEKFLENLQSQEEDKSIREKALENPRNRSFPESFDSLQESEKQEHEDIHESDAFKDDPYFDSDEWDPRD